MLTSTADLWECLGLTQGARMLGIKVRQVIPIPAVSPEELVPLKLAAKKQEPNAEHGLAILG